MGPSRETSPSVPSREIDTREWETSNVPRDAVWSTGGTCIRQGAARSTTGSVRPDRRECRVHTNNNAINRQFARVHTCISIRSNRKNTTRSVRRRRVMSVVSLGTTVAFLSFFFWGGGGAKKPFRRISRHGEKTAVTVIAAGGVRSRQTFGGRKCGPDENFAARKSEFYCRRPLTVCSNHVLSPSARAHGSLDDRGETITTTPLYSLGPRDRTLSLSHSQAITVRRRARIVISRCHYSGCGTWRRGRDK